MFVHIYLTVVSSALPCVGLVVLVQQGRSVKYISRQQQLVAGLTRGPVQKPTRPTACTALFLEHMEFMGTHLYSQQAFELKVENMGGHLNASTSREQTAHSANMFRQDVPQAADII